MQQIDASRQVLAASVGTTQLANLAVTAAILAANAVTNVKVDAAAAIASTKLADWSADRGAGGFKLTNLGAPSSASDAATKAYVDGIASGLDVKASVRAASTANIAGTYSSTGGTGRGSFSTGMPNTVDGVSLANGNRVLLKNQSTPAQNGIYTVTSVGSGSNGAWERSSDFDTDAEVTSGAFTFVEEGTLGAGTGWILTTANPITVGGASSPTSLTFTQFSSAGIYTAGNGLSLTGTQLDVNVDGSTIEINSDTLRVKALGITASHIANNTITATQIANATITATQIATSVAGAGLNGGGGTALSVDDKFEVPSGTINGVTTAFTLSAAPSSTSRVLVFQRGLLQIPTTDYSVSGTTLTMVTAPATGDDLRVFYLAA